MTLTISVGIRLLIREEGEPPQGRWSGGIFESRQIASRFMAIKKCWSRRLGA